MIKVLSGKIAVVTGAASGIRRGFARRTPYAAGARQGRAGVARQRPAAALHWCHAGRQAFDP